MTSHALAKFDPAIDAPRAGHEIYDYDSGPAVERGILAAWVFVASEALLFAGLFSAYVLLRGASPAWDAHHFSLNRAAALGGSVLLLSSSWTMSRAVRGARGGAGRGRDAWIAATLVLGAAFLGVQGFEHRELVHAGFRPNTDLPWSCFYVLSGIHGLHVLGGLVWIGCVGLLARGTSQAGAGLVALEAASV